TGAHLANDTRTRESREILRGDRAASEAGSGAAALQRRTQESHENGRQAEKGEEPEQVSECRDEDRRGQGGIDLQRAQPQGKQRTGHRRHEDVEYHGGHHDQPEHPLAARNNPHGNRTEQADGQSVAEANYPLLHQRLTGVAPGEFSDGDAAHDDSQRLRGRVPAQTGNDGHEGRQDDDLLDRGGEHADNGRRDERGDEVDGQPRQTPAQRFARRREHAVVDRDAGHPVDVLGRLVLDDVDDVIDGDDADELVLEVDDRDGEQIVGGHLPGHFLLIEVHARAVHIGGHDALERRVGRYEQEAPQRDDLHEVAPL